MLLFAMTAMCPTGSEITGSQPEIEPSLPTPSPDWTLAVGRGLERLVGERLRFVEQLVQRLDPARPDRRVGEVQPDDLGELLGRLGAALAEQVEVRLDDRLALDLVAPVDREREEVAVGVGVDVARH